MSKIIGIDLGTTNSVVAVMEGGSTKVIPNEEGQNTTPSVVAFTKDGKRLVGVLAKRQAVTNPENTIFSSQKIYWRKYDEVADEIKNMPYKVVKRANGDVAVLAQGKEYTPQEISAAILSKLKQSLKIIWDKRLQKLLLLFLHILMIAKTSNKRCRKNCGLDVKRIINEPTAAALLMALIKRKMAQLQYLTLVAEHLIFQS